MPAKVAKLILPQMRDKNQETIIRIYPDTSTPTQNQSTANYMLSLSYKKLNDDDVLNKLKIGRRACYYGHRPGCCSVCCPGCKCSHCCSVCIIIILFESQIILAEHECCTNWGDCKSNKSTQIKCWFLWRRENRSSRRKTSRSRVKNQQTQPTYDAGSGNRTQDTLVGGERSHHCANPAPLVTRVICLVMKSPSFLTQYIYCPVAILFSLSMRQEQVLSTW